MASINTPSSQEKRHGGRIPAPAGTRAFIKTSTGSVDTLCVSDISTSGLLVSGDISGKRFPLNTSMNVFLVDIPPCELTDHNKMYFPISRGEVVRSFFDQSAETFCYGIALKDATSYVKSRLETLVENYHPIP